MGLFFWIQTHVTLAHFRLKLTIFKRLTIWLDQYDYIKNIYKLFFILLKDDMFRNIPVQIGENTQMGADVKRTET